MLELGPSRTALFMAAYRARATRAPNAICRDEWAAELAGEEGFDLAKKYDAVYGHMELWTAVRTAFIDQRVRRALSPAWGMKQIVILGAGLDTRAARLSFPGVRFFEVDHPESQAHKRRRIEAASGYPVQSASYVPCDFEKQDFLDQLVRSGFREVEPAFFVWEGVTPYLTEAAVRSTLRRVATGTSPSSVVVFDHLRKKIVAGDVADPNDLQSREFVGDLGEPLRWGTDDVLPVLYSEGFRRVRVTSFDEACLDFTGTYERDRKFRFQSMAVASRGAGELP
ncbi:MAG: class I SAM-dependent methyltransferase [Polyangiaceae bacterium]|nr:class I SAM-dependent methyltransferase [Polyangiaceae bacterium]